MSSLNQHQHCRRVYSRLGLAVWFLTALLLNIQAAEASSPLGLNRLDEYGLKILDNKPDGQPSQLNLRYHEVRLSWIVHHPESQIPATVTTVPRVQSTRLSIDEQSRSTELFPGLVLEKELLATPRFWDATTNKLGWRAYPIHLLIQICYEESCQAAALLSLGDLLQILPDAAIDVALFGSLKGQLNDEPTLPIATLQVRRLAAKESDSGLDGFNWLYDHNLLVRWKTLQEGTYVDDAGSDRVPEWALEMHLVRPAQDYPGALSYSTSLAGLSLTNDNSVTDSSIVGKQLVGLRTQIPGPYLLAHLLNDYEFTQHRLAGRFTSSFATFKKESAHPIGDCCMDLSRCSQVHDSPNLCGSVQIFQKPNAAYDPRMSQLYFPANCVPWWYQHNNNLDFCTPKSAAYDPANPETLEPPALVISLFDFNGGDYEGLVGENPEVNHTVGWEMVNLTDSFAAKRQLLTLSNHNHTGVPASAEVELEWIAAAK